MKKDIRTVDLFERLGGEIPGIKIRWSSYLYTERSNVIHADATIIGHELIFTNVAAIRAYAPRKSINDLHKQEYLQNHKVTRTLTGIMIRLETFI